MRFHAKNDPADNAELTIEFSIQMSNDDLIVTLNPQDIDNKDDALVVTISRDELVNAVSELTGYWKHITKEQQ